MWKRKKERKKETNMITMKENNLKEQKKGRKKERMN